MSKQSFPKVSIARRTLIYDWRRYAAAVAALGLSGLLMLAQIGLLFGQFATFTVTLRQSNADLIVTSGDSLSFDASVDIPERYVGRFWVDPAVQGVDRQGQFGGDWRKGSRRVPVLGIPLSLDPASPVRMQSIPQNLMAALSEPGAVLIDEADARKLGINRIGDTAEINRQRVRVVGFISGFRSSWGAFVFASQATARLLGDDDRSNPLYLIQVKDPREAEATRDRLNANALGAPYRVWEKHDLIKSSEMVWLIDSGAGASFGFSAFVAFLVGIGVTSQTLRGAVLAQLKELASLRALGVPASKLRAIVVEQAIWVGLVGIAVMLVGAGLVQILAGVFKVAIAYPWPASVTCCLFLLIVALLSGVHAVRALYRSNPTELLL
ncbi:FtsX-like permease family protein [Aquidulcibacter sp.]|uniref:ABC transporter permease n=1 Tax=Aquidulcibacter sp. TaxID=2052990 RepID=UPI0025C100A7|nr:ABC transporter permease [Aquidulcibacter sp.]MCA3693086.1 ABC transporter permease [Aquidulcibacter sp.]